jgi:small ligand-binding sensory domain FIST
MRFGSACAVIKDLDQALAETSEAAQAQLGPDQPDLALVFVTSHFEDDANHIAGSLSARFPSALLVGCSGEGVLGPDAEHERVPALSIMLGRLPDVQLNPLRAEPQDLSNPEQAHAWMDELKATEPDSPPAFLLFGDPFSVPINSLLKLFNTALPGRPVIGGMVSGCEEPGQSVLFLGQKVYRNGAIGVRITGNIEMRTVVSQGCRPLGERFVITKGHQNIIQQLGGKPALQQLRELLRQLSGDDLLQAQQSLFVGLAIDEHKDEFRRGDFVIRNLLAGDPNSGAMMVGDEIRVGTSVQFHVRDGHSADEDLRELLSSAHAEHEPAGALLFTCNGRGTRMWEEPNHDVSVLKEICGPSPVAGFFAAGELGPVEGRNFVHGHTASIGLFYQPDS